VLIIEDEPFFAMDLQSVLELVGASSFAFADTHKEAVAAALAQKPAVITSDVMLLEGRGPDAVAEIRALIGYIPVIYMTATPGECGEALGGDVILHKPMNRHYLQSAFSAIYQS
jgi:CheY-like chemotaxis protein